jgi:hypothetical protein
VPLRPTPSWSLLIDPVALTPTTTSTNNISNESSKWIGLLLSNFTSRRIQAQNLFVEYAQWIIYILLVMCILKDGSTDLCFCTINNFCVGP